MNLDLRASSYSQELKKKNQIRTSCGEKECGNIWTMLRVGILKGTTNLRNKVFHIDLLFSSVQLLSRVRLFATPESQHARPSCPSPTPGVHSDSRPSSQWCHPAISSSVVPFSSCPQSLPASESFPMSERCIAKRNKIYVYTKLVHES